MALAQQMGYIDNVLSSRCGLVIFAVVSLLALISYALSGWKQWGWLFPAGVFGGLAVTIALAAANVDSAAVASPLFFGLIIPFAAAYLTDRTPQLVGIDPRRRDVVPGVDHSAGRLTPGDEWVGALFLFMIALSFLVVYLNNRTRIWALIVAYVTGVLGIAPLMSIGGRDRGIFWSHLPLRSCLAVLHRLLPLCRKLVGDHPCRRIDNDCHHCRACHRRVHPLMRMRADMPMPC